MPRVPAKLPKNWVQPEPPAAQPRTLETATVTPESVPGWPPSGDLWAALRCPAAISGGHYDHSIDELYEMAIRHVPDAVSVIVERRAALGR